MKTKYIVLITIVSFTIALLLLLINSSISPNIQANSITAKNGVFKLNNFDHQQLIALDGEWEFYFNGLYTPEDFLNKSIKEKPNHVKVPSDWNHYDLHNQKITRTGYATYRLQIQLPKNEIGTLKTLYIPSISAAYTLWIDGEKKASNGIVGTSRENMKPERSPSIVQFQPYSQTVELVVQSSNYNQRKSGIWDSILLGEPHVIHSYQNKKNIYRAVIVTSLLIMGLYHLTLFALRKKEVSLLFIGGFCVAIAIRAATLEEGLAIYLFSSLDWEITTKIEYLGATLGTLFFSLFSYTQFPLEMNRKLRNIIASIMVIYSLFIVLTPAIVFTVTMVPLQIIIMLILLYLLFVYILALLRKRTGALLNVLAIIILVFVALNDIFYFNELVKTIEMTSIGLIFFLFTQSFNLSKEYAKSYDKIEKLSLELKLFNETLEKEVNERTAELKKSNEQLQAANELRRRLLTNISHELGTPLTSIQGYMKALSDGVIPSEDKYIQLVYEKVVYLSQILNDLYALTEIETRQIKFEMIQIDIQQYCNRLYEKHKLDLIKSNITFTFKNELKSEQNYLVNIDPFRIEQVIINFLTNARKFTPENGEITLILSSADHEYVKIQCIDNGSGIDERDLNFVFERFYKGYTLENPHKGAGLGLSISKEIIEFHKGKIGVTSKVGVGSCFYFILPIILQK